MKLLVTAGNTQAPIDGVRCITNIFTGRTGAAIALDAYQRGHTVTLLTSQPDAVTALAAPPTDKNRWRCTVYRTYDDLEHAMAHLILGGDLDAVIHSAAVSDYRVTGIFAPAPDTCLDSRSLTWQGQPPMLLDRAAGKIKSDDLELWLRLERTRKLIDCIRREWKFEGVLVKFKLEANVAESRLLEIAEQSRQHSAADWMVANTLEEAAVCAYLGSAAGYQRFPRHELAPRLLDAVEQQHGEQRHG
jgi:phosphopantothenoylcysteine synthetase/decarboxylase